MSKINLQLFGESEDEAVDILKEINADYDGMGTALQVEVAKLAQLKRIADTLERIGTDCLTVSGNVEVSGDIDVSTDKLY